MYPWERVIASKDSTLRIIHEAVKRGHEVSITHPSNLTIRERIKNIVQNSTIRKY
jgi:glutathione synthase